jgi:hypothetical protein
MRPMKWYITDSEVLGKALHFVACAEQPFTLTFSKDKDRTGAQNNLVHKWFADIAKQKGDESAAEIKALCNLTYGRPILDRDDEEWKAAFGYIFDSLSHAAKLKAMRVLDVPITRRMSVVQLSEYMDQMARDYREQGFRLTDPEGWT